MSDKKDKKSNADKKGGATYRSPYLSRPTSARKSTKPSTYYGSRFDEPFSPIGNPSNRMAMPRATQKYALRKKESPLNALTRDYVRQFGDKVDGRTEQAKMAYVKGMINYNKSYDPRTGFFGMPSPLPGTTNKRPTSKTNLFSNVGYITTQLPGQDKRVRKTSKIGKRPSWNSEWQAREPVGRR